MPKVGLMLKPYIRLYYKLAGLELKKPAICPDPVIYAKVLLPLYGR
jgi:hypothetical protein